MEEKQRGLRFGSVEFSGYGAFPEQFTTELISRGVELLDHIIVAEDDYVSLADSGILQR